MSLPVGSDNNEEGKHLSFKLNFKYSKYLIIVSVLKNVQLIFGRSKTYLLRMDSEDLIRQVFKV